MQIPLSNKTNQKQSWKVSLAEKLTGRPLGDFGDPEDIAEAATFLASERYRMRLQTCVMKAKIMFLSMQIEIHVWSLYRCQWWPFVIRKQLY